MGKFHSYKAILGLNKGPKNDFCDDGILFKNNLIKFTIWFKGQHEGRVDSAITINFQFTTRIFLWIYN